MTPVRFGMFLAPHHRVGFSPSQQMRDDQRDHEASKANAAQS